MNRNDSLKLENQLCFPLYVCSKEIIKKYKPFLDHLDLTYTQYITMMILWEQLEINVKSLGEKLYLDSGTLTPLLKKLENKGYIVRKRDLKDERNLIISITKKGKSLKKIAQTIPLKMSQCISLEKQDMLQLHQLLSKILDNIQKN